MIEVYLSYGSYRRDLEVLGMWGTELSTGASKSVTVRKVFVVVSVILDCRIGSPSILRIYESCHCDNTCYM